MTLRKEDGVSQPPHMATARATAAVRAILEWRQTYFRTPTLVRLQNTNCSTGIHASSGVVIDKCSVCIRKIQREVLDE